MSALVRGSYSTNGDATTISVAASSLVRQPAVTGVAIRSTSQAQASGSNGLIYGNVPAGAAVGDIMVALIDNDNPTGTLTPPDASWTQLDLVAISAPNGQHSAVYWKRLTGADSGSYLFSSSSTYSIELQIICLSGAGATVTPSISAASISTVANGSPITVPVNGLAAASGDVLLYILALDDTNLNAFTYAAPSGFTIQTQETSAVYVPAFIASAPGPLSAGTVSSVSTSAGASAGYIAWTVLIPALNNQAPIANAGSPQTVASQALVTLAGSGTGSPTSYAWTQTSGTVVTLSSSTVASPTFTAPANPAGQTLVFSLTATNANGTSPASTVTITVTPHTEWIYSAGAWQTTKSVIL